MGRNTILTSASDTIFFWFGCPTHMATLRRPRLRMPPDVREVLVEKKLMGAYRARPPYQRNDYLAWFARATTTPTRRGRIEIMVNELAAGHGFMTMDWRPTRARAKKE